MTRKRIGWLDSTRAPSHIHATDDEGESTVCGNHRPKDRMREADTWTGTIRPRNVIFEVPRKILGSSRYCKGGCFKEGGHSIPWVTPPGPEDFLENGILKPAVKSTHPVEVAGPLAGEPEQPIRTPDYQEWLSLTEDAASLADEAELVGLAISVEVPEELREAIKTVIVRCTHMLALLKPGYVREPAPCCEEKKS